MMLSELHLFEAQALKEGRVTQAELAAATPHTPLKAKPGAAGVPGGRRDPAAEAQARLSQFPQPH